MDANMPDCLGETIAAVFACGDLFARPASYEIMLDVPVYLVMVSGRVFRLFGESLREVSGEDTSFLDAQKHSSSFSETKDALSILCGKRILKFLAPHGTDGLLIVLDEGLTLECLCGVMEEFSIIRVLERI